MNEMAARIINGSEEIINLEKLQYKDVFHMIGEDRKSKVIGWSTDKTNKPVLLTTSPDSPDHLLRCHNVLRGGPSGINEFSVISDSYPKID